MQLPKQYQNMMEELLEDYPAYRDSLLRPWERGLRLNTLKVRAPKERERVLSELYREEPREGIPWSPEGYYLSPDAAPSEHPFYQAGLYYLQEPSAQAPAAELPVRPGDRVLDLCAAPGGKSTQLLAKLAGKGILVANDPSAGRCAALRKNLELFGAKNAFVTVEEPGRLAGVFPGYFDAILVDAPCSGSGMFRKEPAMAAFYETNGPSAYVKPQEEILEAAAVMLRPGGYLMYSTCTFAPEEDELQIERFLGRHPEFSLRPLAHQPLYAAGPANESLSFCGRLYPHRLRGEGQFLALLQREDAPGTTRAPLKKVKDAPVLYEKEDCIYLLPEGVRPFGGLRYLMTGLCAAKKKGKRLKPTQALAMALTSEEWPSTLVLPAGDERVKRYLKGESVTLMPGDEIRKGTVPDWLPPELDLRGLLVTVEGWPLGFAQNQNGLLKNLRDAGWRMK